MVIRRRRTGREAQALQETKTFPPNEPFVFQLSVLRVNIGFLVRELLPVANNCQLKSASHKPLLNNSSHIRQRVHSLTVGVEMVVEASVQQDTKPSESTDRWLALLRDDMMVSNF